MNAVLLIQPSINEIPEFLHSSISKKQVKKNFNGTYSNAKKSPLVTKIRTNVK